MQKNTNKNQSKTQNTGKNQKDNATNQYGSKKND